MVATVVGCAALSMSGVAFGASVLETRPFWTGVPPGGSLTECAGIGSYAVNTYYFGAGTAYGETKYSFGGYCNNWLNRPFGWLTVNSYSRRSNGTNCSTGTTYNATNAPNAYITTGSCGGAMKFLLASVRYQHPDIANDPFAQLETQN